MSLSIKVILNGSDWGKGDFEVFSTDDGQSVLDRVSLRLNENESRAHTILPSYLRFGTKEFIYHSKLKEIQITDIRHELKSISLLRDIVGYSEGKIYHPGKLSSLLIDYPLLDGKTIGILWVQKIGSVPVSLDELKMLSPADFHFQHSVTSLLKDYPDVVKEKLKAVRERIERRQRSLRELKQYRKKGEIGQTSAVRRSGSAIQIDEFQVSKVRQIYAINVKDGDDLLGIFDAFDVNVNVPFIALYFKGREYYKIYKNFPIPIPLMWVEEFQETIVNKNTLIHSRRSDRQPIEGIFIKVLHSLELSLRGIRSTKAENPIVLNIDSQYGTAVWTNSNIVHFSYNIKEKMTQSIMRDRLFGSLNSSKEIEVIRERQSSIDGKFTIQSFEPIRIVLADMISVDDCVSEFFFFDEKEKAVAAKKRFYIHFTDDERQTSMTLTLSTVTSEGSSDRSTNVTLSGASNIQQVNSLQIILRYTLERYNFLKDDVLGMYRKILGSDTLDKLLDIHVKKQKPSKVKKTGKRADALFAHDPKLFVKGYTSQCQQRNQPYVIVGKENAEAKLKEILEEDPSLKEVSDPTHLMLNFPLGSDDYYFCAPREESDKEKGHIWPGLHHNTKLENKKDYPFFPCCYIKDPHGKSKGGLVDYLRTQGHDLKQKKTKKADQDYILGSNKPAPLDRYADAPYHIEQLLSLNKFKRTKRGKNAVFSIVRTGVGDMSDSFVHCLLRATDKGYIKMDTDQRRDAARDVERKWSEKWDSYKAETTQELMGVKPTFIEEDENVYVDPLKIVGIAESYYNCNIILLKIDSSTPNGEFCIPGYDPVYLRRTFDTKLPTFVCVMFEVEETPYPYKCELLCDIGELDNPESKSPLFDFKGTKLLHILEEILFMHYQLCQALPRYTKCIAPLNTRSDFFEDVVRQSADERGKIRLIQFPDGVNLYTEPIPPIQGVKGTKLAISHLKTTIEQALEFIERKGLNVKSQVIKDTRCVGFQVSGAFLDDAYIPIVPSTKIVKNVDLADPYFQPPITESTTQEKSELEVYRRNVRIANVLMQYALYLYSLNPDKFSKSFMIDPDHSLDKMPLTRRILKPEDDNDERVWRNGKLIVTDEETRKRLKNYVEITVYNNRSLVLEMKYKQLFDNYYSSPSDFNQSPSQVVFTSPEKMDAWRQYSEEKRKLNDERIEHLFKYTLEPYFFKIDDGRVCIIQLVVSGEKDGSGSTTLQRAMSVCERWESDRINLGAVAPL